jgi:sulfiredoxin
VDAPSRLIAHSETKMCIAPIEKFARWQRQFSRCLLLSNQIGRWLSNRAIKGPPAVRSSPMKREIFKVADIYVPVKRRATLEQRRVKEIAISMLEEGQHMPILVRPDGARLVLIEGLHRLEAAKALGETTIVGYRVDARKH